MYTEEINFPNIIVESVYRATEISRYTGSRYAGITFDQTGQLHWVRSRTTSRSFINSDRVPGKNKFRVFILYIRLLKNINIRAENYIVFRR